MAFFAIHIPIEGDDDLLLKAFCAWIDKFQSEEGPGKYFVGVEYIDTPEDMRERSVKIAKSISPE